MEGVRADVHEESMMMPTPTNDILQQRQSEAPFSNPIPLRKDWKYHPKEQVLGKVDEGIKTRFSFKDLMNSLALISKIEPKKLMKPLPTKAGLKLCNKSYINSKSTKYRNLYPYLKIILSSIRRGYTSTNLMTKVTWYVTMIG